MSISIRISKEAYDYLKNKARKSRRTVPATLDLILDIFKEGDEIELESESLPPENGGQLSLASKKMDDSTE